MSICLVSKRITELRRERGVTLKSVGNSTGISPSLLSLYEHGETVPGYWNLLTLARYFDVSVDYLCGITSERKEYPHE